MHLRSYVCDEDVDVAVRIILESFISTQKASVMRQMRKNFERYIFVSRDHNELLLYLLKQLVKDQLHYERARHNERTLSAISIPESDFTEKMIDPSPYLLKQKTVHRSFQLARNSATISH
ncbi:unnamed protein product [Onchocerca flexuosa]|uniref:RGS domain-containing protein n=1 Tax=Onchocerca flexuosa TaxID=387005 RepID=A0A183HMU8_9BILA|nr:unnamed protein product [Onchocerca flexuosa]